MKRAILSALLCALLGACATARPPEPQIVTQEVKVPVPTPCAAQAPARPAFADDQPAIKAAPDIFERTKLLLAGREQRDGYIGQLEAANSACKAPDH